MRSTIFMPAALMASLVLGPAALAADVLICREEVGGWCESDGACYKNTKPPALFLIAAEMPSNGASVRGYMSECRDECGDKWPITVRRSGGVLIAERVGEIFQISLETGFYGKVMLSSATTEGRATHTFGTCTVAGE